MPGTWKPVVAGVDGSSEAVRAASLAWTIAEAARVECRLVHAVRDQAAEVARVQLPMDPTPMGQALIAVASAEVRRMLQGAVPDHVLAGLDVRIGSPEAVLKASADEAAVVVLGGKPHGALNRWWAGRTAHHLLSTLDAPLLVAAPGVRRPRRVLAAVDLGPVVRTTLAFAQRYAELLDAELLVLHAVEPVPSTLESSLLVDAVVGEDLVFDRSAQAFEQGVWPCVEYGRADRLLRRGLASDVIKDQAKAWKADLLVVGSHGKGMFDRLLVGSTTHRLVDDLPTSLLVVPALSARPRSATAPRALAASR